MRACNSTTMLRSLITELIPTLYSSVGLSLGLILSGSPTGPTGNAVFSAWTLAFWDGQPISTSDLVVAISTSRSMTCRSHPLAPFTLGPNIPLLGYGVGVRKHFFFYPYFLPSFFVFSFFFLSGPTFHIVPLNPHHMNLVDAQYGLRGPS